MGIPIPHVSNSISYVVNPKNPDPSRLLIVKSEQHGDYWVTLVNYLGCTNYEGMKILITTKEIPCNCFYLDPHFTENSPYGLIARFVPTETGWAAAIETAKHLTRKR